MDPSINYDWCEIVSLNGVTHTADSPEWQSAAMVEGFADFYAAAVFNQFGPGAWVIRDDIENDTQRFLAQCPASLNSLKMKGKCDLPGDATSCADAGASNETDWAGTLWDFAKVVGEEQLPAVLLLLSDAFQLTWDPGSITINAYNNMRHAALVRFPANEIDFHAAARATEPTADVRGPIIGMMLALLTLGCGGCGSRTAVSDGGDAQGTPDLPPPPTDLPVEPTEYEGIVVGINYHAEPSRFYACDTGELWEMTYHNAPPGWRVEGSCEGVFKRIRGQLDRSVDPPVLIIEETLEARWSEPDECVVNWMPVYDSCFQENERYPCDPLATFSSESCPGFRCNPVHFWATEEAGWMETRCADLLGNGQAGDACGYPEEPWEVDTCAHGLRCWNPAGDVKQPGVCVPYCDPTGEVGPVCEGTCVQCSGDDRGLCMQGCTGDGCNVDAFC